MDKDNIRFFASIITSLCLVILVPIQTWQLMRLVDHGERLAVVENAFESFSGQGPRYTEDRAKADLGVVIVAVETNKDGITENRLRIRDLEKQKK